MRRSELSQDLENVERKGFNVWNKNELVRGNARKVNFSCITTTITTTITTKTTTTTKAKKTAIS